MFKFLHTADIHLDSPLHKLEAYEGAPVEELRRASRRAFENMVDLAIDEKVEFVLIAGDLYDGDWKDYNTGLYLVAQTSRLREAGISVYIIAGNHDAASRITKTLRLPENVTLFAAETHETLHIEKLGVAIHGQSFAVPAVKKDLSVEYPSRLGGAFNIGMLHTCATGREGHDAYAPCTVEGLRSKGYDYWALGHIHKREMLSEDPPIVFSGNIQGRHIRETGPKGCMLVIVDDRGGVSLEFKPVDIARWWRVEVEASTAETAYDIVDLISERLGALLEQNEGLPLIARIEVTGDSRAHEELSSNPERWTSEVRSAAMDISGGRVWLERIRFHTREFAGSESRSALSGPVGELIQHLNKIRTDPEELGRLAKTLEDLKKKLPPELKDKEEGITLDNPEWLAQILEQVKPMLLDRLMKRGGQA